MMEKIFTYESAQKVEYHREGQRVTKEYKQGALDPTNKQSKYEQKAAFQKRQKLSMKRRAG